MVLRLFLSCSGPRIPWGPIPLPYRKHWSVSSLSRCVLRTIYARFCTRARTRVPLARSLAPRRHSSILLILYILPPGMFVPATHLRFLAHPWTLSFFFSFFFSARLLILIWKYRLSNLPPISTGRPRPSTKLISPRPSIVYSRWLRNRRFRGGRPSAEKGKRKNKFKY